MKEKLYKYTATQVNKSKFEYNLEVIETIFSN